MPVSLINVLVRAFGGGQREIKIPKAIEVVNTSGMSTWVEQVSWTPLNEYIGLIRFKPKRGKWYTVPNQTYDTFLQLIKPGLVPGAGTGTEIWTAGFLRGLGRVRQRSKRAKKLIAGYEQKRSIRKLADAFRSSDKKGREALAKYVGKFGSDSIPVATRIVKGLRSALKMARMLA